METNIPIADRLLRKADVVALTGVSNSTRDRLIAAGQFPRPIAITERTVAWEGAAILRWKADRKAADDAAVALAN